MYPLRLVLAAVLQRPSWWPHTSRAGARRPTPVGAVAWVRPTYLLVTTHAGRGGTNIPVCRTELLMAFEVRHKRLVKAGEIGITHTPLGLDERIILNKGNEPNFRECLCKVSPGLLEVDDTPKGDVMKLDKIHIPLTKTKICGVHPVASMLGEEHVVQVKISSTSKIITPGTTILAYYFSSQTLEEASEFIHACQSAVIDEKAKGNEKLRLVSLPKLVQRCDVVGVREHLESTHISIPILVNTPNPYGNTPLHLAVRGALNSATDSSAQMKLHMQLIAVLLGAGSDPFHKNLEGQSPMKMVENPRSELCLRIRQVLMTTQLKYEDGGIYLCPDPDPLQQISVFPADGTNHEVKRKKKGWVYRWAENERVHLPSPVEGQKDEDTLQRLYHSHYTDNALNLGTASLRTELSEAFAQRSSLKSLIMGAHAQAPPSTIASCVTRPRHPAHRHVEGRGRVSARPLSAHTRPKQSSLLRPSTATGRGPPRTPTATGRELLRSSTANGQSSLLYTQQRSLTWTSDSKTRASVRPSTASRPRPASAALRAEGRPRPATGIEAEEEADSAVHRNFCRKVSLSMHIPTFKIAEDLQR